ncbi:MAG TPA: hypothetical protein VJ803_09935 [Gemmatimonadaceae bacterium]|nr:hypothetical protein [Gemmatimonadaceae bacterium]
MLRLLQMLALPLALPIALAVCSPPLERTTTVLSDSAPARTSPETTNIYDEWVLATPVDSTAFSGAERVELSLTTTTFTIAATYPGATRVVISGSSGRRPDDGPLVLVPRTITRAGNSLQTHAGLTVGDTLALLASASGNVLVFAPPGAQAGQPSSVWHRRSP